MDHNDWRTDQFPCTESHDGFHHFPLNVHTRVERKDCIECGLTQEQILYRFLNKAKKKRTGEVPPIGKFPKPKSPSNFPKPKKPR